MAKMIWDELDKEAERQGWAIRSQRQNMGDRCRADLSIGGRHTSRTRNRRCVVATPSRVAIAADLGVIR